VAKINGACIAGGLDLAMHCDVTIASDRARFRVPELLRGLPDPHMSARIVDAVGLSRARYLFFTAAEIDAHAAGAMGLVGEVVPHDELDARTEWILEQISSTGPLARATIKRDLNAQLRHGDVSLFMVPGLSAEITEGMGAFVEKRAAVWPRP
jgi:enoyl-CoA hydratase/carnithine racemase